jgi:hypothetical protein
MVMIKEWMIKNRIEAKGQTEFIETCATGI